MSAEKWKEIERNLAEQESFVQSIIEQRQRKSKLQNNANVDNILSTSIQKAKEKISLIDSRSQPPRQDRSFENLATSRDKKQKSSEEGSAIAAAMKKLQQRISSLQTQNKRLESENSQITKRQQNQTQINNNLKRSLEQNRRKVKNLQSSIENDKNWIRELERKNQNLEKQLANKKLQNHSESLQTKLSTSEMMLRAQQQQFKNLIIEAQCKQKKVMQTENKRRQQQIRFTQQINVLKSLNRQLQLKVAGLEERNKQKDILIDSFKHQLKGMEAERLKQSTIANYSKIDYQADDDKYIPQSKASRRKQTEIAHQQRQELEELKQKYEELFNTYKSLDEKSRQDKMDAKNYRNKFWQLKDAVKELIEKIHGLPSGVNAQLKYLIVKINKIETFSADYFAATPTKSARKTSLLNNTSRSKSKSKSNSKNKQTKLDLNRSNNSVKSKRSNTNRSASSKKSSSKEKQVIVSQKTIKKNQLSELESEIQQIRKRYKELVMAQGKGNEEVTEEIREQLNNLAIHLQQKSEELTKLKRKK